MAFLNLLPGRIICAGLFDRSFRLDLGLFELVLTDKMLQKVVASVARMFAFLDIARPPLEMAMAFILMSDPISFPLEHFRVAAVVPGTSKRLNILMYMLRPVRRFDKLAEGETNPAFEFLKLS